MRSNILACVIAASLIAAPAHAKRIAGGATCVDGMQETVTLSINFNLRADSFVDAKKKFDDKMKQITDFAQQQNIGRFELQSMNYSINTNYDGNSQQSYQLSGNASYVMDSTD